ncbi:MAG: B12-binding domain-containing protein [Candidatus Hermodarchaeota archaeon]
MTKEEIAEDFINAAVNMDIKAAKESTKKAINEGIDPYDFIEAAIAKALKIIGDKFENEEFFLPELFMAAEIVKKAMKILEPHIKGSGNQKMLGKIVIGTAKSDMHDIGKNIVSFFLEAEGFEVIDLGVDVSPEQFVDTVRNEKPDILAISTLITLTMPEVSNTLKALENANLRNQIKVIVGGAPITQEFIEDIGADALAINAIDGVKKCKRWVGA